MLFLEGFTLFGFLEVLDLFGDVLSDVERRVLSSVLSAAVRTVVLSVFAVLSKVTDEDVVDSVLRLEILVVVLSEEGEDVVCPFELLLDFLEFFFFRLFTLGFFPLGLSFTFFLFSFPVGEEICELCIAAET